MNRTIEVLAPAGSPDALIAAVRCGAAAIYLGSDNFNARRSAHNFTREELREAVEYCHVRGVAVHLALNTLIGDEEMADALQTAQFACEIGVDALIVQDLGLARLLRQAAPTMPLHASTQLSCHTSSGVDFLRDAGFTRVVLAREMSKEEIASCVGRGVEIEVFVHGALCMSVSGQCYFSAALGGRSGNRGMCAQPCRLPFSPSDSGNHTQSGQAALSLKDQCLIRYMQELRDLGVDSVKIEGRMKRPEYVAATTKAYSSAARGEMVDENTLTALSKIFSRSGFTDGYYTAQRGSAMFGVRRKEDVDATADAVRSLAIRYDKELPLVDITLSLRGSPQSTELTATDPDGHTVTVSGIGTETAVSHAISTDRLREQLCKTGNTPYRVTHTEITIPTDQTMPLSRINALRREALDAMTDVRRRPLSKPFTMPLRTASLEVSKSAKTVVRLASQSQWSPAIQADLIVLPLDTDDESLRRASAAGAVAVEIPRGIFGTEESVRIRINRAKASGVKAVMCHTVNAMTIAAEAGLPIVGGFGLNIFNREALRFWSEYGLCSATVSIEQNLRQIADMHIGLPIGAHVYGRLPLMLTRNCPYRSAQEDRCGQCNHQGLADRTGARFPTVCSNVCAEVLNSVPLYWLDKIDQLPPLDYHLYYFTVETPSEIECILNKTRTPDAITRGLYRRGVQ